MHLKRLRGDFRVVAPDLLPQRLPRYRPLAGAVEVAQDRDLLLGQADLATLGIEQQQLRAWPSSSIRARHEFSEAFSIIDGRGAGWRVVYSQARIHSRNLAGL